MRITRMADVGTTRVCRIYRGRFSLSSSDSDQLGTNECFVSFSFFTSFHFSSHRGIYVRRHVFLRNSKRRKKDFSSVQYHV